MVGVVYRQPTSCQDDFIDNHMKNLLYKLNNEKNKNVFICGDFNFDLLNSTNDVFTSESYDLLSSNFFLPTILVPTKINQKTNTIIDNIFTNQYSPGIISGNFTISISDHLPSFAIFPYQKIR